MTWTILRNGFLIHNNIYIYIYHCSKFACTCMFNTYEYVCTYTWFMCWYVSHDISFFKHNHLTQCLFVNVCHTHIHIHIHMYIDMYEVLEIRPHHISHMPVWLCYLNCCFERFVRVVRVNCGDLFDWSGGWVALGWLKSLGFISFFYVCCWN